MRPGRPARQDFEYERHGTANLFLWCEPLRGRRHVTVTERRTKVDWAHVIKDLVDVHYPEAEEAKRLADKLELHYTPKHRSWLNIAELELSVLARQGLDRRIADRETLELEVAAWEAERNGLGGSIDWRFTTEDARIKLKRLYPSIDV